MKKHKILWADDEIELLKSHVLFLTQRGYEVTEVNSGADALEEINKKSFDLVFLDENMPGISGLETLNLLKISHPNIPVVLITKNEAEEIMEEAIGAKIADYIIKPINPHQVLLSIKKILDNKRIVSEKTNQGYQKEFSRLGIDVMDANSHEDWIGIYKRLVQWELRIDQTEDKSMNDVLLTQKNDAELGFINFLTKNYEKWINNEVADKPLLSHELLKKSVFPLLEDNTPTFLIVIDNLRYDQWKLIEPDIAQLFTIDSEELYFSILPTTTAYARNALFGGMTMLEMYTKYPNYWVNDDVEGRKNDFEEELLGINLERNNKKVKYSYHKIIQDEQGKQLLKQVSNLMTHSLNGIVFNFVDMLSHARSDIQMIRQLTPDESAYRSITHSWFLHSSLYELLKMLSEQKVKVVITTDHGTVRVTKPQKIVGDRSTNTNLRYKVGRSLTFNEKEVFYSRDPKRLGLPSSNVSSSYAFCKSNNFFVYPNNYNHFVRMYRDTFQHGGLSMEEVIIPLITLKSKT